MKKFVLLFRMDITSKAAQPSKAQMELYMQQWMEWIRYIDDKGQLAEGGNHLSRKGRVIKPNKSVSETPYISENNSVAGYIIVKTKNLNEATALAKKCPILDGKNTSVEIREVAGE